MIEPDRRPIVGVMGSGVDPHEARANAVATLLASLGVHLLTGGGGGVMTAVTRAFVNTPGRTGVAIGVLPARPDRLETLGGYPNPFVEMPIRTHLHQLGVEGDQPASRNHINVLTSDAVIALPGGPGTSSEVRLALRYERPVIAFIGARDDIPNLPDDVETADDLERVRSFLTKHLALTP